MKKKTLRFKRITLDQFNAYFHLDSPGYFIARDAGKADEVGSPLEAVEIVCLANLLYEIELTNRLMVELHPYGALDEYLRKRGTDEGTALIVRVLGKQRTTKILRQVMDQVRREVKIGENDKKRRRPADD
jgi:hypothetical protein